MVLYTLYYITTHILVFVTVAQHCQEKYNIVVTEERGGSAHRPQSMPGINRPKKVRHLGAPQKRVELAKYASCELCTVYWHLHFKSAPSKV